MLFHSLEFAVFLGVVFSTYWLLCRGARSQNALILVASYVFYGWWDWRFLGLIVLSSVIDYKVGLALEKAEGRRRPLLLGTSLCANLGLLAVFKYYDFFVQSWVELGRIVGLEVDVARLGLVLPVGISFYTFQTLSYTIDVYRGRIRPTHDPVAFLAYVSFFPQLVAGPIERASHLLPQFATVRHLDVEDAKDGLRQMLWGFFKKVVLADTCAPLADLAFDAPEKHASTFLLLGVILFAFQIYGDFSGYSDIAIGCARLFGVKLSRNFAYPYFSRDIAEFWRRWHMSLSTWFRDYLYIPLGGSRSPSRARVLINVMVVFVVSGMWHGANWTFIVWGFLHGLYFVPQYLGGTHRRYLDTPATGRGWPPLGEARRMLMTFGLVCLGWVFFRAASVGQAFEYLRQMGTPPYVGLPLNFGIVNSIAAVVIVVVVEWHSRHEPHPLANLRMGQPRRWALYVAFATVIMASLDSNDTFIYFQF